MWDDEWGDPITINGRPAFRKALDDDGKRYLITKYYGGTDNAAVAIWREEEEPIFWGTWYADEDCDALLQTLASVTMRRASQECALMFPPPPKFVSPSSYRPDSSIIPPPPGPLPGPGQSRPAAPSPPPAPRPRGAERLCKDYIDEV